ncbi:MAG: hypothetical protein M3Y48_05110 [Actinomycetota bacterium]|nr:hypothetical protein [Actinomycetota bacterium]
MPTSTPPHAVQVSAGPATVLVTSDDPAVTDWITQYLGCWWLVRPTVPTTKASGPVLRCQIHPARFAAAQGSLSTQAHRVIEFARNPIHVADDTVCAVDSTEQVAYHSDASRTRLTLIANGSLGLCLAAARITRELIRAQLEADGWAIMHASATVRDNNATLALGPKGAGKTTTALLLTAQGQQLLANDRVFLHPATLALLPWPAAAALGLGLLHAHGFLDGVRARLAAGQHLHPTVDPAVTVAILNGRTDPLRDSQGRELKTQLFPHQLTDWLGLRLARSATAAALIFPRMNPAGEPRIDPQSRALTTSDFFDPDHDDRYPDFLRLTRITPEHRHQTWARTREALATIPHHSVVLTHDTTRSGQLLAMNAAAVG